MLESNQCGIETTLQTLATNPAASLNRTNVELKLLNASSAGTTVLPIPHTLQDDQIKRELNDRERLSTAHIQAVTKIVAEQGNQQRGEYADGWMACIRVMCQNLGVEIPENIKIPFQGMHVNDLTAKILEEMKAVAK